MSDKKHRWAQSFWDRAAAADAHGCRLWQGAIKRGASGGYGVCKYQGTQMNAHRIAWILTYGMPPKGLHVCHRCDVRACCEPTHLFLGTPKENMDDMRAKGRSYHPKGEAAGPSKLTRAAIDAIRAFAWKGVSTNKAIGECLGTNASNVSTIRRYVSWR